MQGSTPVIQDNRQVKETSNDQIFIDATSKSIKLDECERSISLLECDEKENAMNLHKRGGCQKTLVHFAPDPMKAIPVKTVLAFTSLKDLTAFKTIIKGLYLRVNLTRLTITAAFSKEEMELAILNGAKQVKSGC